MKCLSIIKHSAILWAMDISTLPFLPSTPLARVIHIAGNGSKLARLLDISPQAVSQWERKRRPVPARRCEQIEDLFPGVVTRADLRPDLWPEAAKQAA